MNSEAQLTPDDYFAVALHSIGVTPELAKEYEGRVIEMVDRQLTLCGRNDKDLCNWEHRFAGPFYIRTVHIPQGMFLTTGRHLQWHSYYILQGCASWYDELKNKVMLGVAGSENGVHEHFVSITPPGTRRLIYCHTDIVWSTVHPNPWGYTTPEEMEKVLFDIPDLTKYLQ